MRLDITTQPVPLDLSGMQGDFVIYNEGPDTVYLGRDGSVNKDLDISLAPLTYQPWRFGVPLWLVSRGMSRLFITGAMDAPSVDGNKRQQLIYALSGTASSFTQYNAVGSLAECAAYNSLTVNYTSDLAPFATSGSTIYWAVDWYDDTQTFIQRDTYALFPPGGVSPQNAYNAFTIPVKGTFFRLNTYSPAAAWNYNVRVVGSTAALPLLLSPNFNSSATAPDQPVRFDGSGVIGNWTADYCFVTHVAGTWSRLAFKAIKRNLKISFDFGSGANPTGAGSITVYEGINGTRIQNSQTIAAASRYQDFTFSNLPLTIPLYLSFPTNPTATLNPNMHMIWSD